MLYEVERRPIEQPFVNRRMFRRRRGTPGSAFYVSRLAKANAALADRAASSRKALTRVNHARQKRKAAWMAAFRSRTERI
jgi:hypothetical protein